MKSPKPRKSESELRNDPDNPINLFHHYRRVSQDPSISDPERAAARNHMMDVWSVLPWGLAANILDMKD